MTTYLANPSEIEFESLFPEIRPIEVEIGCGKARLLVVRAQEKPDVNFIAIDRIWRFMKTGQYRADRRKLTNIKFIKIEAIPFVTEVLPDESIDVFHIYFPDPWPKRRYVHRRLIQPDFLKILARKTLPGGWLHIRTDHEDYYRHIKSVIADCGGLWVIKKENLNDRLSEESSKTNYELKYESDGRQIHYLELVKK